MANKPLELVGKRFERLTVLSRNPSNTRTGLTRWNCICDCGNETIIDGQSLRKGNTKSCGCIRIENSKKIGQNTNKTHGMTKTPEFNAWANMRTACYNKNNRNYKNYGAKGITVCQRWLDSFENFIEDVGPRPNERYQFRRIDINKNYEPNNCHWVIPFKQKEIEAQSKMNNHNTSKVSEWTLLFGNISNNTNLNNT